MSDLKRASESLREKLQQLSKVELWPIWGSYILVTSIKNSTVEDEFGLTQGVSNSKQMNSRQNLSAGWSSIVYFPIPNLHILKVIWSRKSLKKCQISYLRKMQFSDGESNPGENSGN